MDDFENGLPTGFDADGLAIGFITWGDFWNGTTVAISDPLVEEATRWRCPARVVRTTCWKRI